MQSWEAIKTALNYIEDHLGERLDIDRLAREVYLSTFYFQRLFNRLVGRPVMEYVKLRRLAKSSDDLMNSDDRILDIALAVGFDNHETYSRSFKDAYGFTPSDFRKNPQPLTHFIKPDISMQHHLIDEGVPLLADGIVLEIRRCKLDKPRFFTGMIKDVPFPNKPGRDYLAGLWTDFHKKKSAICGLKQDGNEIGVGSYDFREGYITYFVGAESVDARGPNDNDYWTLPQGNYIVCFFEAENFYLLTTDALDQATDYMYNTWLPAKKIPTAAFLAEIYFDAMPNSAYMELWFKIADSAKEGH